MNTLTFDTLKSYFKPRQSDSHKGNYGHALIIAGEKGKMGAAAIASKACLRSGVGLLTVCIPEEERFILQTNLPEAMLIFRDSKKIDLSRYSAICIGPGLGLATSTEEFISQLISTIKGPLILDADALNIFSKNLHLLNYLPHKSILTPHPKEFDRLFGYHSTSEERIEKAIAKAKELNCVIVLKGSKTLITSNGISFINTTGNAGLAKGGSGDALSGIITAFLAQQYEPFIAAQLGVFIHGLAADIVLKENQSLESMLISDVIDYLGMAFKEITNSFNIN